MTLADEIADAEARLEQLKRQALGATCAEIGHDMQCLGGRNACCDLGRDCACSVPVHECRRCGDCDYGDNPEADEVRAACRLHRDVAEEDEQCRSAQNFPP